MQMQTDLAKSARQYLQGAPANEREIPFRKISDCSTIIYYIADAEILGFALTHAKKILWHNDAVELSFKAQRRSGPVLIILHTEHAPAKKNKKKQDAGSWLFLWTLTIVTTRVVSEQRNTLVAQTHKTEEHQLREKHKHDNRKFLNPIAITCKSELGIRDSTNLQKHAF